MRLSGPTDLSDEDIDEFDAPRARLKDLLHEARGHRRPIVVALVASFIGAGLGLLVRNPVRARRPAEHVGVRVHP